MVELFDELRNDYYLSEQYRKESFSFKCFSTMMRLQYNKLVDNLKIKKIKPNRDKPEPEILK